MDNVKLRMPHREKRADIALLLLGAILLGFGFGWPQEFSSAFTPQPRQDVQIRVLTWNVGGAEGSFGHPLRDEHLDHVARLIRDLDPDLCFLQEVRDDRQLGRLQEKLGPDWRTRISPHTTDRRIAALSQRGRLSTFSTPYSTKALGIIYRAKGMPAIAAACVHAAAYSAKERNREIGAMVDRLIERKDSRIKIFAGDLNLDLDLDKRRDLFTDDEYRDVESYNYVANRFTDVGQGRGSTAEPDRRLDYIFISGETLEVLSAGPWKGRRAGDMDHDPVIADLTVRD